jgi:hypothetical protein
MRLESPNDDDLSRIAQQWMIARSIVAEVSGQDLDQSLEDLKRIQHVLDQGALGPEQAYELQCLGIAFGRILISNIDGLDWAAIDDEYGRDPTIRYQETSLQLNVLTMISKRVEDGADVDVEHLFKWIKDHLQELAAEIG